MSAVRELFDMLSQPYRLAAGVPMLLRYELEFAEGLFERLVTPRSQLLDPPIYFTEPRGGAL
jgi:hypothetical protein